MGVAWQAFRIFYPSSDFLYKMGGKSAQNKMVFHLLVTVGGVVVPSLKHQFHFIEDIEVYKMGGWFHKPFLQNGWQHVFPIIFLVKMPELLL